MWKWKRLKCNKYTSYAYLINDHDSSLKQWENTNETLE